MEHPSKDMPSNAGGEWWADKLSHLCDAGRTFCGDCTSSWDQNLGGGIESLCYEFEDGRLLCVTEDLACLYPSYELFMDGETPLLTAVIGEDEDGKLYAYADEDGCFVRETGVCTCADHES